MSKDEIDDDEDVEPADLTSDEKDDLRLFDLAYRKHLDELRRRTRLKILV